MTPSLRSRCFWTLCEGVFGKAAFDEQMMAAVIQGAIDGLMLQWVFDPNAVDLAQAGHELAELFVQRVQRNAQKRKE